MQSKICTCCGEEKSLEMFSKKKTGRYGVRSQCKSCLLIKNRKYAQNNAEKVNIRSKEWKKNNPEKILEYKKQYRINKADKIKEYRDSRKEVDKELAKIWRENNKDKQAAYAKKWQQKNQHLKTAYQNKRRAQKLNASVEWEKEFTDLVSLEAYHLCGLRKKATGFTWHVDHVIPLCGTNVCGFHVWNNLAVIPAQVNLSKGNKFKLEQYGNK